MWLCENNPIGVHAVTDTADFGPSGRGTPSGTTTVTYTVTVPLDGFAACDCDGFYEAKLKLKSKAEERQVTCRHIAKVFGAHCGWRSTYGSRCAACGLRLVRVEDVVPGWVGQDRKSLLHDLLKLREELHETDG